MANETPMGVTDLVLFSLKPGTTRDQFLGTVDAVSRWALEHPGFVSRDLSYAPAEDRWIEIVKWETLADAERAAEAELSAEACMPMFGLIDWDAIVIMHGDPAIVPIRAGDRLPDPLGRSTVRGTGALDRAAGTMTSTSRRER